MDRVSRTIRFGIKSQNRSEKSNDDRPKAERISRQGGSGNGPIFKQEAVRYQTIWIMPDFLISLSWVTS